MHDERVRQYRVGSEQEQQLCERQRSRRRHQGRVAAVRAKQRQAAEQQRQQQRQDQRYQAEFGEHQFAPQLVVCSARPLSIASFTSLGM